VTLIFLIAIAVNAVLMMVLLLLTVTGGHDDGGREMTLVFSIILPAVIVAGGALLFVKAKSPAVRTIALLIVAGPGLLVASARLRGAVVDYHVRQNAEGSGYFTDRDLQRAGAAVVRRDLAALQALGKKIDVNAKGTDGMTLMELAVTQAEASPAASAGAVAGTPSPLDIVRELIARGADPNAGLAVATKLRDGAILTALLDAGAKPGFWDDHGPVVFNWLNVMPLANLTALLDRGLDPNLTDAQGAPLVIAAGQADRWECVLLLMDRGADASRADRRGTRLAVVVQSREESTTSRPPEMKADIARVKARLPR